MIINYIKLLKPAISVLTICFLLYMIYFDLHLFLGLFFSNPEFSSLLVPIIYENSKTDKYRILSENRGKSAIYM
jgi:hypothetical protein